MLVTPTPSSTAGATGRALEGEAVFVPSVAQPRLPDVIAQQIVQGIQDAGLQPGDRLPTEQELARQLGVGRTSVREGLQKLQTLGLVEVRKGRGAFVLEPPVVDPRDVFARWVGEAGFRIEELLEVRMALEATAAGLACSRATPEDLDALRECAAAHGRAAQDADLAASIESGARFHDILIQASRNRLIERLYAAIVPEITEFRHKSLALPGAPDRSVRGQARIVAAVERHDAAAARHATAEHLWVLYAEIATTAAQHGTPIADVAMRGAFG
jgi:GntR family transcriptional repressor for pyruvate dehydrogenase complex